MSAKTKLPCGRIIIFVNGYWEYEDSGEMYDKGSVIVPFFETVKESIADLEAFKRFASNDVEIDRYDLAIYLLGQLTEGEQKVTEPHSVKGGSMLIHTLSTGVKDVYTASSIELGPTGTLGVIRMNCVSRTQPCDLTVPSNMVTAMVSSGTLEVYNKES